MKQMNKLLILAAVAVATISSCSFIERDFEKFAEKKEAEEAENIAHKTLEVDSFKHIYTEFVYADVEYSQADTTKVEIDYTTDMLSALNIYVQNDTLYILNPKVVDGIWSYAEDWKVKVRCSSKEIKSMHYDINLSASLGSNKIDLTRNADLLALLVAFSCSDHANVNRESTDDQLVVNDIFHNMRHFGLTESDTRVTKSNVLAVIFVGIVKVRASLYVISFAFRKQEGIDQMVNIRFDCVLRHVNMLNSFQGISNFIGV